jgi:putative ATPase
MDADLFEEGRGGRLSEPLAARMRPRTLDQVVGQEHLVDPETGLFWPFIRARRLPSMVLWGPPGVGKTTLAVLLAQAVGLPVYTLSAIQDGVREVREVLQQAQVRGQVVLFIDEIHRFNKAQQDALLQGVETGRVILIGATTENPSFEVVGALLSRCQVYTLHALSPQAIHTLVRRAVSEVYEPEGRNIEIRELDALYHVSGGDGRKALNLLELVAASGHVVLDNATVLATAQQKISLFDKHGEQHYDLASAFIKSLRGSDPNGAVYWLARLLEAGEPVRFIARRMVILASEDIGNANPNALLLATSCFQACDVIGLPEARIILSQTATYLATSPKSNAAYVAINEALEAVRHRPHTAVPLHLRNPSTQLLKNLDYGAGYRYAHDYQPFDPQARQEYLPQGLEGTAFYRPRAIGKEREIQEFIRRCWGEHYTW